MRLAIDTQTEKLELLSLQYQRRASFMTFTRPHLKPTFNNRARRIQCNIELYLPKGVMCGAVFEPTKALWQISFHVAILVALELSPRLA